MVLAAVLSMIRYVGDVDNRDFVDRMHSYFTTNILVAFAIVVSFKQFGGKPVECLVPDIFSGSWAEFAENYCWAQDTYFVPMREVVDGMPVAEKRQRRISYYQWVPFFLLIEAACFRLPSLLWKYMAGHSGIKLHEIVKLSSDSNNIRPEIKKANIKSLTAHLQGALRFHRRLRKKQIHPHRYLRMFNIPYTASFVTCMYLLTKAFYLTNVFAQLVILNKFLVTDNYSWYGFDAVMDLLNGTTWEQSGMFPRVSLCDFEVRVMGNIQEHTIQCVLIINIFNEKIFIFLWFWYLTLLVFTAGSLLYWLTATTFPILSRNFIVRHLELSELPFDPQESKEEVDRFINTFLKSDGLFVIRMITFNSGVIFGTELVCSLWKSYFGLEQQIRRSSSFPASAVVWSPPADKQLGDLDLMNLENAANLKLYEKAVNKVITAEDVGKRLKPLDEAEVPLIRTESARASPMSYKRVIPPSKRPYQEETCLTRRTQAHHSKSPSTNDSSPKSPEFSL